MWTACVICFLSFFVFRVLAVGLALLMGTAAAAAPRMAAFLGLSAIFNCLLSLLSALAVVVMLAWKLIAWVNTQC